MATATEVRRLTQAYRAQQVRRAAVVAALVAAYYRQQVEADDAASVERWLEIMLPRIMSTEGTVARLAASYATETRRMELPSEPELTFTASPGAVEEQIRKSLVVVGPGAYMNKMRQIERTDVDDRQRQALLVEAKQVTARKVAGATVRHIQSGGRRTTVEAARSDRLAQGYVRVTRDKPCFFCAMLASRGLVFAEDSFDLSDPRFTGEGDAKVHDNCQCGMKPVYNKETDPLVADSLVFTDLWERWGAGGGDAALRFRRGYEHWVATGEFLDFETVDDTDLFRARKSA
jgi:hypothetical protein